VDEFNYRDEEPALHKYTLTSNPDGSIKGLAWTNDNLDHGQPTEIDQWEVSYRDYEHMKKSTGLSHTGIVGSITEVYLDGEKV